MSGSARRPIRSPETGPRTWIFQANPKMYKITTSLRAEQEEYWNLRQYAREIAPRDRVLIWLCGTKAGIYALGTVASPATDSADTMTGQGYWNEKEEGEKVLPRAWVRYERVFLERPLLKAFIECDPDLWNLSILQQPRGTNFPVTDDEWRALEGWLEYAPSQETIEGRWLSTKQSM